MQHNPRDYLGQKGLVVDVDQRARKAPRVKEDAEDLKDHLVR